MRSQREENLLGRVRENTDLNNVKKVYKKYADLSELLDSYRIKNCSFDNGIGNLNYMDYDAFTPQYVRFLVSDIFDGYEDEMGISYNEILDNYSNLMENEEYFNQIINCFDYDDYQNIVKVVNRTKVFKHPYFKENKYGDYYIEFDIPTNPTSEEFRSIKNAFIKMFKDMR